MSTEDTRYQIIHPRREKNRPTPQYRTEFKTLPASPASPGSSSIQYIIVRTRIRLKKTTPQYVAFAKTNPILVPNYPPMEPYQSKQILPEKIKRKITGRRKLAFKVFPQFQAWFKVLPFFVAFAPVFQPYTYESFLKIWKRKPKDRKRKAMIPSLRYNNIQSLFNIWSITSGQPWILKQFIPLFKKKILKRRRLNLKFGTPKTVTFQVTNPALDPSIFTAPIQPDPNKQWLAKRIKQKIAKRRHLVFKVFPQFQAFFELILLRTIAEIQPYLLKQLIPHWKRKLQQRRRFNLKKFPTFQTWYSILPTLSASIYQSPTEPYVAKQLIPKLKKKLQIRRRLNMKFGTPKYQAWWSTNPALSSSVWASAVQPYLLKQLLPKFKKRLLARKRFNAKYGTPQFKQWFKVLPVFIPSAAVIQPYVYLNLFTKWKHKLEARKKRLIATRSAENYRMVTWLTTLHESLTAITLTVIDILLKTLKVPK